MSEKYTSPESFGFSPEASGIQNANALQKALDLGGTVAVYTTGTYKIATTVYIGGNTTLIFGAGVFLEKTDETGEFCHVILNKGALTKVYDEHIEVRGLYVKVNGMDNRKFQVFGLHGQLAFFYVKDLKISGFRCMDLGRAQYGIHICTFEDISVTDTIIKGDKDGVHLGKGKRFYIGGGTFETGDDAVALNAHDYDVGNPELGWIEDGIVENCHDLASERRAGYFCRILAGAWVDWYEGMEVQKSDTVVHNGRLYRVRANPDGTMYVSKTPPTHSSGIMEINGISWVMVQDDVTYTVGVRNVTFRNIFVSKHRSSAFSVHFDTGRYSRSVYPGAQLPVQENLSFDNIRILHKNRMPFIGVSTPIDNLLVTQSSLYDNPIVFYAPAEADTFEYPPTNISLFGCVLNGRKLDSLIENRIPGKQVELISAANIEK